MAVIGRLAGCSSLSLDLRRAVQVQLSTANSTAAPPYGQVALAQPSARDDDEQPSVQPKGGYMKYPANCSDPGVTPAISLPGPTRRSEFCSKNT